MGGSYSSSHSRPEIEPGSLSRLYNQQLPSILGTTFGQAGNAANSLAGAAAGANPIYTASGQQQLQQYLPGYQQAGIDASTRQASASADLLGGEGARVAQGANALSQQINPNWHTNADQVSQASGDLLGSFGRNGTLGGGEMAAAERAINQGNASTGNSGQFNPYNTAANALNFGQYARQKQSLLGGAIGQVNATLPNMVNPSFNPVSTALNSGNVAGNFGLGQYNPTQANASLNAGTQFGQSVLGGITQLGSNAVQEGKDTRVSGPSCCFIFMEAYEGDMPWVVRKCRDRYYKKFPNIANGYRKMACVLVPYMRRYKFVRHMVWHYMVHPLTQYGRFVLRHDPNGRDYKWSRKFWFTIWNFLGK